MRTLRISLAVAGVFAVSGIASAANELIATVVQPEKGGRNVGVAIDVVSDGTVAGFSYRIDVPGLNASGASLKRCVVDLPKGFTGSCSAVKDGILVIASSDVAGVMLPAGVVSIGTVYFSRTIQSKSNRSVPGAGNVSISGVEFSNNNGVSTVGTAKVQAD